MKRAVLCLTAAVLLFVCGCTGKYDAVPPTEEEQRVVANVAGYDIYYDELRFAAMTAKKQMAEYYGIDWNNPDDAEKYRDELYRRVWDGLPYNSAVLRLFAAAQYSPEEQSLQEAVERRVAALIDSCGKRSDYLEYLEEHYLTDRVVRLNFLIAVIEDQLIYVLRDDIGAIDDISFDFSEIDVGNLEKAYDYIYSGDLIHTEHIYIPGTLENAAGLAQELCERAREGESLTGLATENSYGGEVVREALHQMSGEKDKNYYTAAASLEEGGVSDVIETGGGYYIIKRLPLDDEYVSENLQDIIYRHLYMQTLDYIDDYIDRTKDRETKLTKTGFGEGTDLVAMK